MFFNIIFIFLYLYLFFFSTINAYIPTDAPSSMDDGIWVAHFHSNSHPIIWTDKAHYNIGDTVKVFGKFGPDFTKSVSKGDWIAGDMILLIPNKNSNYDEKIIEKNIPVNKDRTFSTSFKLTSDLSSDFEGAEDTITLRTGKIPWKYLIKIGNEDVPFFVGNVNHKIDPFDVWIKTADSGSLKYGITTDSENYKVAVRNHVPITRITLPSGMVHTTAGSVGQAETGADFRYTVAGYGKYSIEITYAGNSDIEFFEHKKPAPSNPQITLNPSENIVKSQSIRMYFEIYSIDPEKRNFSYKITDPSNQVVDSGTNMLDWYDGWYNSGGKTSGYVDIDTNTFPDIDGEYSVTVNYEGLSVSKKIEFKAFSSEFNINKIYHELELLMNNSELYVPNFFGNEFAEKFASAINSGDIPLRNEYYIEISEKRIEKLNDLQKQYEKEIELWNIPTDEKVNLIFDLRNKIDELLMKSEKSITQYESNTQQHYRTLESQEQYRINQEKEETRIEQEITDEKQKIREELGLDSEELTVNEKEEQKLISTNLARFVDSNKDPQHYIDRYNNEPSYKKWFHDNYPQYDTIEQAVGLTLTEKIPSWVKNIMGWYAADQVSEDELLNAIKYLIDEGILII